MFALFLTAVFFSGRETFREQFDLLGDRARVATTAAVAATGGGALTPEKIETIYHTLSVLPASDSAVVFVLDLERHAIVSVRAPAALASAVAFDAVPFAGRHADPDGIERVYGSATGGDGRWAVTMGSSNRQVWDLIIPVYRRNAINAGWWYLLSVGALVLFVTRWLRSADVLKGIAARVTAGDLSTPAPVPMATRELEEIQASMVDMVTRVRELQRQVVRQERLAAIGVLVSGVAHEINNPLQAVLGYAQVLAARPELTAEARADLGIILHESERAGHIIRNLSRFTRQQPAGPTAIRLNDIVHWLAEMWTRRFEDNHIQFEVSDRSTRTALAVATEIQQVALNFLTNAEYSVVNNPTPAAARHVILRTYDTEGGCVRLEVEDSGAGVPAADESKLFQPFYTTKPVGEGTGLGLSVSYGIVQSHGGTIGYERGALGGARFFLELPAIS